MTDLTPEDELRLFFTGEHPSLEKARRTFRRLPSSPRCRVCLAPFRGLGGIVVRRLGFTPWSKNPNVCQRCIVELSGVESKGTEVELTLLFADVRGSTMLAEQMSPSAFSVLMNRFFHAATQVLLDSHALVDKFVGDEVIGLYVPAIAGPDHARQAVDAARSLLLATGHDDDPWLPLGVGVHTGTAFLGMVGRDTVSDFTAMGDAVNLAARLAGAAGAGEILVTDSTRTAAGMGHPRDRRTLDLKGIGQPVQVSVLGVSEQLAAS